VLRVLDVGTLPDGAPFAVRESALCTMAAELEVKGSLPVAQAVAWTLEACEAIAEAHALGMAHGDLRLDNVYLVRGTPDPKVKVAWTSAAKAERAAKEDVARDIAGLGVMLRLLATGHVTDEDSATTLPSDVAHAVARALAKGADGSFQNVSDLARALAPYAPQGHTSARNIAFMLSRAGIVGRPIPKESAPRSARATSAAAAPVADRASFTDEWFGKGNRTSLVGQVAPRSNHRATAFALVSIALVALVLGGSWLLWHDGKLPRWTGAAPPESVGTAEVTSAPAVPEENANANAQENANANAQENTAAPAAAAPVESLPSAPATNAVSEPPAERVARPAHAPTTVPAKAKPEVRYADPEPSAAITGARTSATSTPAPITTTPPATTAAPSDDTTPVTPATAPDPTTTLPVQEREPGGIY
jgi:serine/threonine-protein kinase